MRAVVYHGPGDRRLEHVPDPRIEAPGDVIVRLTTTTICGTDLQRGKLDPRPFATHSFTLDRAVEAYDVFGAAAKNKAIKVTIAP